MPRPVDDVGLPSEVLLRLHKLHARRKVKQLGGHDGAVPLRVLLEPVVQVLERDDDALDVFAVLEPLGREVAALVVGVEVDLDADDQGSGDQLPAQRLEDGEHIQRVVVPLEDLYRRLEEYSKRDRTIVAAMLFHFAAGMEFMKTRTYF